MALSREFGAQAVVLAIDAKLIGEGTALAVPIRNTTTGVLTPAVTRHWDVRVRGGRDSANLDALAWALRGVELGAGEILLTSMDRDGTQSGFDVALTSTISRAVSVPVIASGGARTPAHFAEIFSTGAADAALAASIFHDNVQSIRALKQFLASQNIEVRIPC